ncbi:MAG: NYN domain-containing protein [Ignavibacteriae bacterium]|nr:NYN domain-containing protein [Ignavibacteriota bacterium]
MKIYLIDGNNLIGKIKSVQNIHQKTKNQSRQNLAKILDKYFSDKKVKVHLHFDGFENDPISSAKMKIIYSNNKSADSEIIKEIDNSKNPKLLVVVSSDSKINNYAKVNSCETIKSEDFAKLILKRKNISEEQIQKTIAENEIKKLFGVE